VNVLNEIPYLSKVSKIENLLKNIDLHAMLRNDNLKYYLKVEILFC